MTSYPYQAPALLVEQPIGTFFVTVLPAELLLDVAFSDALSATYVSGTQSYELDGTQRLPQPKRLDPIADFINRTDAAFPNAIILAANYRKEDGLIEDEPTSDESDDADQAPAESIDRRWSVAEADDGCYTLTIPTADKLAAIIDGQHRLFAFARAIAPRRDMHLICSVFLDLPKPYQAQLFATINSTQKPVDKSLTFELFGYNIAEEDSALWSPDKLAVFLTRRLGTDPDSPLKGRIVIAPKRDEALKKLDEEANAKWKVSTAVVVEGIMKLFTTNPKKDTNSLLTAKSQQRSILRDQRRDRSPLREYYLSGNDSLIYELVKNYMAACERTFWAKALAGSFITKTVGVQALFDVLKSNVKELVDERNITVQRFADLLAPAADIDFASNEFRNASGSGRSVIRRAIQGAIDSSLETEDEDS